MSPKRAEGHKPAQKVNISVPGDLFERLEAVKDRFNVSAVCQEAIRKEVEVQELLMKGGTDMEALKDRLRAEKEQNAEQYSELGRKHGVHDAKKLSLSDFKKVEKLEGLQVSDSYEITSQDLGDLDYWDSVEAEMTEQERQAEEFDRDAYSRGWVEGVLEVWAEVKDEI